MDREYVYPKIEIILFHEEDVFLQNSQDETLEDLDWN